MPQMILVCELLLTANRHGEARPPYSLIRTALAAAVLIGLLLWGGFFS